VAGLEGCAGARPPAPPFQDGPGVGHLNPIPATRPPFSGDNTSQVLTYDTPHTFREIRRRGYYFQDISLFRLHYCQGGWYVILNRKDYPGILLTCSGNLLSFSKEKRKLFQAQYPKWEYS
jgi:hypothetical protein